ncbi:hypothetical protein [Paenibacillus aceti]|uniref:Uncharacterized protein n=1 Tax=Paenibacillus aceti TaxID=1820010 RepID=A0ABQ1VS58_9BACL|nr:hypothetical protein [Paenibacillus aceti]GGF89741.1 hypothetical protein GCM10010913_08940 [Paenibacillus aceti]
MPKILLDSQVSMNSSTTDSIAVPLTTTPALFATLGLDATDAGSNLEVQFTVTATVSILVSLLVTPVVITVVRVVSGVPTVIYSATHDLPIASALTNTVITFNGVDYLPPADFLVYEAFISVPPDLGIVVFPTRVGPESMIAAAYSD